MAREECKALLDALNKATACYHHLVLTVGGSADSQNLREELQKTRQKAQELAVATRAQLTAALRDRGLGAEERAEFERLWVAFSGCLDLLEADMRRALALGTAFPLHAPRRPPLQYSLLLVRPERAAAGLPRLDRGGELPGRACWAGVGTHRNLRMRAPASSQGPSGISPA
ncbi:regulator of G-protein signaling 9-binding protein-like [Leptonychotes weddellii]|uniref:Regulator of G-protein signaling 9-binding protein-like n=1 Tax=Leptonychotes weddellii TaxID=9713 RepID=A0A7F8QDF9_LEPWE|nr:regulator of G-protein signaling 9-binding protein-like [Leptonychotes weddellii]